MTTFHKTFTYIFSKRPLKSANCSSTPFLDNPPYILLFCDSTLKIRFFSEPHNMQFLLSLIPTPSFKNNEILSVNWQRKTFLLINFYSRMERFTLCFLDIQYLIFGLQMCPIHTNCRSWNLKTHIFWGKVWHHILKEIDHFQWRHEVCPLNQFSCTKFNHLR